VDTEIPVKLIKRYPNRKLYDTESSTYVTLDDIAKMVKSGRELKIIDHKTGNDITDVTLAQIVFEEGKRKKNTLPLSTLKDLIQQRGGQVREFVDRIVHENPFTHAKEEAEEKLQHILRKSESARDDSSKFFRELVTGYTRSIEDVQKKFDERIREVGDRLASLPSALGDLRAFIDRLEKMEDRLAAMEERLDKIESSTSGSAEK
jgi:polyhydroxyalkanoate synthesis repressor PhaR